MIWFGRVLKHINHCRLFNAKFSLYKYWFVDILWKSVLNEPELIFLHTSKWFQVLLCSNNNLTSVISLHSFKYDLLILFLKDLEVAFLHTSIAIQSHGFTYYKHKSFYLILIICLYTVKWLQVLLFNTNYSIEHFSFICTQLTGCQSLVYTQFYS